MIQVFWSTLMIVDCLSTDPSSGFLDSLQLQVVVECHGFVSALDPGQPRWLWILLNHVLPSEASRGSGSPDSEVVIVMES